jgi:hypothetical protein
MPGCPSDSKVPAVRAARLSSADLRRGDLEGAAAEVLLAFRGFCVILSSLAIATYGGHARRATCCREKKMTRRMLLGTITALLLLGPAIPVEPAHAQCILANPSFEIGGSGGNAFGGWNQFGNVSATEFVTHGSLAARLRGPDWGGWDVSAVWQQFDSYPGERWALTGNVAHYFASPLTGDCRAIVNIEWWNETDMMSYDSYVVALPSAPTDEYQDFSILSDPAPSGTVAIHVLFAVLQSPHDPPPVVFYDQVTVFSQSYPTMDDLQWNDFPGGRTITFSDRTWRVKGPGFYGPGANHFASSSDHVWVDDNQLHMTLRNVGGTWYSTEVALVEALGYGDYIFTTEGRLDLLDDCVILGMFLWQYGPCWDESYTWWNPYNEFDIEFGRWGDPYRDIGQFVCQPWDWYGNISQFDATFSEGEITSHAFRWLPDRVECRSWRGGPVDEAPENMIHSWTYWGPHIPRPEQPRVHINLWKSCDYPASDQEVVLDAFNFFPADPTGVDEPDEELDGRTAHLLPARPNPFNPVTTIGYSLKEEGAAELAVFDLAGRRVRTLVRGNVPAGEHEVVWDGRDGGGNPVGSGVYFYTLRVGDALETRRMVLVK